MSQAPAPSAMSVRDVEKLIEATNTYMRPSISAPTLRGKRPSSAPLSRAARNMVGFTHASAAEHQAIQPVRSSRQQSGPPPASGLNVAEWRAKQHPQRPSSAGPRREQQQPPQQPPQLLPSQQQQQPSRPARPQSAGPSRERSQNQVIDLASGQVIAEGATAARPQRPLSATFVRKAARDARLELQRARPGSAQPRSRPSLTGGHQPIIDRSQSTAEMRTGANLISAGAGAAWVASQAERPTKPEWVSTNYLTTPAWRPPSAVQLSIPNVGRVGLAADNKRRVQERTERRQQLAQTGDVDPTDPKHTPAAKGASYAADINTHLAHNALGRIIVQRERYVDWAKALLQSVQSAVEPPPPHPRRPSQFGNNAAAAPAPAAPAAEESPRESSTTKMLMTRREELLSILGALCVITIQLAEQISLWRHTLNSPMLIPLWHGIKYADKALKDGRELLMKAHALELFELPPSPLALLPIWDGCATRHGAAKLLEGAADQHHGHGQSQQHHSEGPAARRMVRFSSAPGLLEHTEQHTAAWTAAHAPAPPPRKWVSAAASSAHSSSIAFSIDEVASGDASEDELQHTDAAIIGSYAEAEAAFREFMRLGGYVKCLLPSQEEIEAPEVPYPPHQPPLSHEVIPVPGGPYPPLSAAAAQVAMFAVGALSLSPRDLIKVMHTSERLLQQVAATPDTPPPVQPETPHAPSKGEITLAPPPAADADQPPPPPSPPPLPLKQSNLVELSESIRTPADGIDAHMKRRAMVGLQARMPRLTPLEKHCGRVLKSIHLLGLGACIFLQMHARCYLALKRRVYTTNQPEGWSSVLPTRYEDAIIGENESKQIAGCLRLSILQRRLLRCWKARLDPQRLVRNEDTFLAPLVIARRTAAATLLQGGWRRQQAIRWKNNSYAARRVQRMWRRHMNRAKMKETRRQAVDLTKRTKLALHYLQLEFGELELRCQPESSVKAVPPALRALALIRGRVLDSARERIKVMVMREVERVTPNELTRPEVKALLQLATNGLFPEHEEEFDDELSEIDGEEEEEEEKALKPWQEGYKRRGSDPPAPSSPQPEALHPNLQINRYPSLPTLAPSTARPLREGHLAG